MSERRKTSSHVDMVVVFLPSHFPSVSLSTRFTVKMLKSVVWLWLLSALSVTVLAATAPVCPSDFSIRGCTSSSTKQSTKTDAPKASQASTTSSASPVGGGQGNGADTSSAGPSAGVAAATAVNETPATRTATVTNGGDLAAQTSGSSSSGSADVSKSATSGLSSAAKAGIGVGVGVGIPLIAGAIALFFFLRRRKSTNSRYDSGTSSAAQLRDQPAMSSGAPAMAGISGMARSDSKHSLPRTPSQYSMEAVPPPPPEPTIQPQSQHSLARAPSQHSAAPSLPEQENLMPAPPAYEDAPSPLKEHPEPVSPVSPISPMGSRPPSPMNDYDR